MFENEKKKQRKMSINHEIAKGFHVNEWRKNRLAAQSQLTNTLSKLVTLVETIQKNSVDLMNDYNTDTEAIYQLEKTINEITCQISTNKNLSEIF